MEIRAEYIVYVTPIEAGNWFKIFADAIIIRSDQLCSGCRDEGERGAPDIEAYLDGQPVMKTNFRDLVEIKIVPQERKHRV